MSICDPILKAESNHRLKNKTKNENQENSSQEKSSSLLQGILKCELARACMTDYMYECVCVWPSPNPNSTPELDQGFEIWENGQLGKCQPKIKKCFLCKPRIPNEI